MAGSEELGLREDMLRVLAAFLRRGEAVGSPIPTPPRPCYPRFLCPGGPAAGTAGPRATEIPTYRGRLSTHGDPPLFPSRRASWQFHLWI
uniref:BCL2 like 12 n=1 Tax=Capra hircus TaxID=9925 RepID=A0A452ENM9_CAPHI